MKVACLLVIEILYAGCILPAQDADTIILKDDNRKFTLVSQIENPQEASAFLAILHTNAPADRYQLAQTFIRQYPQSWLLPHAFDISARSAIDLEKYDEAIADGGFSLRLVPENPSLLILMANVEARKKHFEVASCEADDALEYLEQIERPPNLTQSEWNNIRPQLESSAYFARSRAEASRGLATNTPNILRTALGDLDKAAAWNREDPEVFYLRAIIEIQLDQKMMAASDLAFVYSGNSELREKAKKILSILSKQLSTDRMPFEAFMKSLPPRAIDSTLRQESQSHANAEALTYGYADPAACQRCHPKEYSAWRMTGMARMLQPYQPKNVLGDFSSSAQYSEVPERGTGRDIIRLGVQNRPFFEIRSQGQWSRYYVDFTIGSKWQQGYATKLPDGRLQVLPIEYNLLQKKWVNYWKILDPPGSVRANIQEFPKLTPATNYQQNCAICHTSQLKADVNTSSSMEHASYREPGIDCEMCHGPSAWHIKQVSQSGTQHLDPLQPPLDFRKVSNRDGVRVCAQCHRQSAVREIGEGGELNYSTKGSFVPASWLRPYDAFSRKAFYKDGRFRETTFIVESFTRSACYLRGTAQCATCHSPHLGDFETNQTSLKFQANPNEMCLGCHAGFRARVAEHTRHAKDSEASQCVTCHMPRIVNALLFKARSHQIEIPTADLTERFGQQESPNVCLTCHSEKAVAWAKQQLAGWRN
jgi:predicted CXXCH cytochrome family protein